MVRLAQETYPSFISPTPPELTAAAFESGEELCSSSMARPISLICAYTRTSETQPITIHD